VAKIDGVGTFNNTVGVIPYLALEPDEFEAEVARYRAGGIEETTFTPWRLRRGVYGQRQPEAQMMRIKLPGGLANAAQLEALAQVTDAYVPLNRGHITTRENIQFHHVKLEDAGQVMRVLGEVGLSTREACGNTVRNVIADPLIGVDPQQAFDITPYLVAFVRKFVRHPIPQNMPRKIKTAFSSGDHDPALAGMHDLGFIAKVQDVDGTPRKGFKVVVGGGTSIQAKVAATLYEFVPVEEYLRVSEAVLRVFNQADELRQNKMMARIKVLVHRYGIEKVREWVEEELAKPWAQEGDYDPEPLMAYAQETPPTLPGNGSTGGDNNKEFQVWKRTNVMEQAQKGYFAAYAKVSQGDLTGEQFRGIAKAAAQYGSGSVGFSAEQNLAFRWVPEASLFGLWQELETIGLGDGGVYSITDVTSCPGTDSCKLGITSSMGLNRAVIDGLNESPELLGDPLVNKLHVKMSGCPNGCGRHHLANIGFHGASIKGPEGQQVPAYEMFIGGGFENGQLEYGGRLKAKVAAKMVPQAVSRVLHYYQEQRNDGEEFNDFVHRTDSGAFEALLAEFRDVGPLNKDNLPMYMDWGKTILYKLERGEGECAV